MSTVQTFLDEFGRVIRWPKKNQDKLSVLKYLKKKFDIDAKYTELEVNQILSKWHLFHDHALLRREMYNKFLLNRTPDCREYWVNTDNKDMCDET